MRLIICFDKNKIRDIEVSSNDYIICNGTIIESKSNIIDINSCKLDYSYYKLRFEEIMNYYLNSTVLNESTKSLIKSFSTNLYFHNLRYSLLWSQAFLELSDKKFNEIIFTDYTPEIKYFPFYEAEGEVKSKLLYKNYDFISSQIMQQAQEYVNRNPSCNIRVIDQHSVVFLRSRIFFRRYGLLFVKFLFHFYKIVFTKKFNLENVPKDTDCIISTRAIAHSNNLQYIFKNKKNLIIHVSEGITFSKKNFSQLKKRHTNLSGQYENLSIKDLFNSFRICFFQIKQKDKIKSFKIMGINLHLRSVFIESSISYLEADLYSKSIFNLAKKINNIKVVITPEILSQFSKPLHNLLGDNNIKLIQLQTVRINLIPCPSFVFSNVFLFNNFTDYNFFKNQFTDAIHKVSYWGGLFPTIKSILPKTEIKSIIYFTQPYEQNIQKEIILFLIRISNMFSFRLFIKAHPRENVKELISSIPFTLNLLKEEVDVQDYVETFDLAILRTSSLSHDLILSGLPIINLAISNYDKSINLDFLKENNINVKKSLSDVESLFYDKEYFLKCFYEFRLKYIDTSMSKRNKYIFLERLEKFLQNSN